jgi:hypothetical protein
MMSCPKAVFFCYIVQHFLALISFTSPLLTFPEHWKECYSSSSLNKPLNYPLFWERWPVRRMWFNFHSLQYEPSLMKPMQYIHTGILMTIEMSVNSNLIVQESTKKFALSVLTLHNHWAWKSHMISCDVDLKSYQKVVMVFSFLLEFCHNFTKGYVLTDKSLLYLTVFTLMSFISLNKIKLSFHKYHK